LLRIRWQACEAAGVSYDAAGNQLNDIWSTYEYDAEGRVKHSYSTGQWQYPMYNALGQRVQDYQGIDPMTLTYPIDIFGQRTGTFAQWPSQNWTGWNVYWSQVAGQRLNMGGASAYIDHSDAVGSTTMETDPAGGVQWKIAYYPWGQILAQGGVRQSVVWAGLDWQVNDPSYPSATREYNDGLGRWLTPDPGGVKVVKLDDPQTWNMYAYVGNNPTSRNDPSGLYFVVDPEDQAFFENALVDLYRRSSGRALVESLASSRKPVMLGRAELNTAETGIAGISTALAVSGENTVEGVQVIVGTDPDLLSGAQMAPGQMGPALTTGHELEHAEAGLEAGARSLQAGNEAMHAGDKPTSLTGSAQAGAEAIMGEKPDESKKAARAAVQAILQSGNNQWHKSTDKQALCAQNDLHSGCK
jgi:RHS repeat-associated protein